MRIFILALIVLASCSCSHVDKTITEDALTVHPMKTENIPVPLPTMRPLFIHIRLNGRVQTCKPDMDNCVDSITPALNALKLANTLQAKAVLLEINTEGGSIDAGFELARAIEQSSMPVTCVVDWNALSMGYYILQSCDVRVMTKRSILMIHQPAFDLERVSGNQNLFEDYGSWLEHMNLAMVQHNIAKTKIPMKLVLKKIEYKMWFLGWEEALKYKAVDCIVDTTQTVRRRLYRDPYGACAD